MIGKTRTEVNTRGVKNVEILTKEVKLRVHSMPPHALSDFIIH